MHRDEVFDHALSTNPHTAAFPILYNDQLISAPEWPGVSISYRFISDTTQKPIPRLKVA